MIYDCFLLSDELDVLELRLNELSTVVDRFVIVESSQTFSGKPKPLNLRANWERYKNFHDRITYVTVDKLQVQQKDHECSWQRQSYQRDAILDGLGDCEDDDWIIISDCDEIPRPEAISKFDPSRGITRLKQRTYYYSFNWLLDYGSDPASRCRIGTFNSLMELKSADQFRDYLRDDPRCPTIEHAGWHCSYFGGDIERVKRKVQSFSHHNEYSIGPDSQLIFDMATGKDLHHRIDSGVPQQLRWMTIDRSLPSFFLSHREQFAHFTNDYFVERYVL